MRTQSNGRNVLSGKTNLILRQMAKDYQIYLLVLPALAFILIFNYLPMYGAQIAFKEYRISQGIFGSQWVGLKYFIKFFNLPNFWTLISNTLGLSIYQLIVGFPIPIILSIMLNEVRSLKFKKSLQMVVYAPHFISTVVVSGMIVLFLNADRGLINNVSAFLGGPQIDYLSRPEWFKTIYVLSGVWQEAGWGTIIYIAVLSTIDPQLVESCKIDGANRLQKIWHIDIPGITPTIVILLILRVGNLLSIGFEKVLLLQNSLNMEASDIISTYVYRVGLLGAQYSFSSAIGLFNSVVNLILLVAVNQIARKTNETSLW